jgi:hypothetical protein
MESTTPSRRAGPWRRTDVALAKQNHRPGRSAGVSPALSDRRAGGTPALRVRAALAKQSHRADVGTEPVISAERQNNFGRKCQRSQRPRFAATRLAPVPRRLGYCRCGLVAKSSRPDLANVPGTGAHRLVKDCARRRRGNAVCGSWLPMARAVPRYRDVAGSSQIGTRDPEVQRPFRFAATRFQLGM